MEDVLAAHAERAAAANAELVERAGRLRDEADARMREKVMAFGARLLDSAKQAEAAHLALVEDLRRIGEDLRAATQQALDANVAEIALSAGAMHGEIADRTAFMATGVLPSQAAPLPGATSLVFRETDPAGGEVIVLSRQAATDAERSDDQ